MHRQDDDREARDEGVPPTKPRGWTVSRSGVGWRVLLAVVVVILLVVFALLNLRRVQVNFLVLTAGTRVVTVIAVAALLGFVLGWFVGRPARDERRHLRDRRAGRNDDGRH